MKNWPHTKGREDLPAERRVKGEGGQSEQLRTWEGAGEAAPEGPQTRLKHSAGAKEELPCTAGMTGHCPPRADGRERRAEGRLTPLTPPTVFTKPAILHDPCLLQYSI